jgi:hypothetical protein
MTESFLSVPNAGEGKRFSALLARYQTIGMIRMQLNLTAEK